MKIETVGGGFFPLLAVLFIGLKLSGHITWSWWWVLAPLWGPVVVAIGILFFIALMNNDAHSRRKW